MNIEAIKNREILATQGPWEIVKSEETGVQIGTTWEHGQLEGCVPVVTTAHGVSGTTIYINDNNAEFIAHARQDVPALIAEIERLQNELAKTQRLLDTTELSEAKGRIEIERLHRFIETLQGVHFKELETEKAENRRLCEALEFYADEDWYYLKQDGVIVILKDGGDIAREALVGDSDE